MKAKDRIINNINLGLFEYHQDVKEMTDKELWEHCFCEPDVREEDYCIQELKSRFFKVTLAFVYKHLDNNGKVFYIGNGAKRRPYDRRSRSDKWHEVAKNGYTVEIVAELPKKDAFELEKKLQTEIGLDNLVNEIIGSSFRHTKKTIDKMKNTLKSQNRIYPKKEKIIFTRVCEKCGNEYKTTIKITKYCSKKCAMIVNNPSKHLRKEIIGIHNTTREKVEFKSMREAERNGFKQSSISKCIHGKEGLKSHKNYKWYVK